MIEIKGYLLERYACTKKYKCLKQNWYLNFDSCATINYELNLDILCGA